MRQRAADLLAVASQYGSFPILLETYRECLRDVFDLPALSGLMADIRSRQVRVVGLDTTVPSPFASSLAFGYVANFMYEGDAPLAERRAQALTLDRDMLAELLGADELRELIDATALADLEASRQHLDESRWARSVDAAHDLLLRLGDLTVAELRARSVDDFSPVLLDARRVLSVRIAGEARLIAVEDAGLYRDAIGVPPPPGVPAAFLAPVTDALLSVLRRWARGRGPFLTAEAASRFGLGGPTVAAVLDRLVAAGTVVIGEFRPDGVEREWCDVEVLRLLRQRSLAALRREVEPTDQVTLARFLPAWQGVGSQAGGPDRLYEVIGQLQGVAIPASVLERDVLPPRVRDYSPRLLDELCAAGEVVWIGAGALGRDDGRVMLFVRDEAPLLVPPVPVSAPGPQGGEHDRLRGVLAERGACFFRELSGLDDRSTLDALWDLVWAGEVTNDSYAAVRAAVGGSSRGSRPASPRSRLRGRPRPGSLAALGPPRGQGRWTLTAREVAARVDSTVAAHARAAALLERHGVLTREAVRGEGVAGGFAGAYPVLRAMEEAGAIRRGYFVSGLGGAQFALPGAVDRLRSYRSDEPAPLVLAATDPANAYGLALPWPVKGLQRAAGAQVVLLEGKASLYLDKGGRGLSALRPFDGTWEQPAVSALTSLVGTGRAKRLSLERVPEELRPFLVAAGFVPTPRGLVFYA